MNQENKLISVCKADFLKIIRDLDIDRINVYRNSDYGDGILVVTGNNPFKEFMKCRVQEDISDRKPREQKCEDCKNYKPQNEEKSKCKFYSIADPKGCIDFEEIKDE